MIVKFRTRHIDVSRIVSVSDPVPILDQFPESLGIEVHFQLLDKPICFAAGEPSQVHMMHPSKDELRSLREDHASLIQQWRAVRSH